MPELSNEEALALLARMDAEQRTMESLMSARKHVTAVIERYRFILAELPTLETAYEKFSHAKARLQEEADAEKGRLDADVAAKRESVGNVIAQCDERIAQAIARAEAAERDAQEKEAFAAKRGQQLAAEIESKVAQLSSAEHALIEFKQKHGLG